MTLIDAALKYRNVYNFSIIPVSKTKKPIIKWEEFQKRIATEEEIKQWWDKSPDANIGIVTGIISGIAVVDIDTEEGKEAIQKYIPDSLVIPTVKTPRGGQHLYFKCLDAKLNNNSRVIAGCDLRANGGYVVAPPSINGEGNAYTWIVPLKNGTSTLPEKYISYINSFSLNRNVITPITNDNIPLQMLTLGTRDNDLYHIAICMARGGAKQIETLEVLNILGKNCIPPFPENEILTKVESAYKRLEKRQVSFTQEIRNWVCLQNGYFLLTDAKRSLQLLTREEENHLYVVMNRLAKEGLIEKHGTRSGQYRKIETDIDYINWYDADETSHLPIIYPLDLHTYVLTLPKNIVIIAGSKDAGKTAFLLNVAALNRDKFKIYYFTSEMGEVEMKKRLVLISKGLNIPLKELRDKVAWINRAENFPDLIFPEAVNIIDFLEITKDFYEVGDLVKNIYHKLTTGIAIIAIQKPSSRDMPIGGEKGLEKARLAIAIDNNRAKILVGKNWAIDTNPKGLECRFHILKGSEIIMAEMWDKKEQKEGRF